MEKESFDFIAERTGILAAAKTSPQALALNAVGEDGSYDELVAAGGMFANLVERQRLEQN